MSVRQSVCTGGSALEEIEAAGKNVAEKIWAAEDWAAKKLSLPLTWGHGDSLHHAAGGIAVLHLLASQSQCKHGTCRL